MTSPQPLVLDMDGVIIESNSIKHEVMLTLFANHEHEMDAIRAYINANTGMRRDHKLVHILSDILHIEPTKPLIEDYLARYEAALAERIAQAPLLPGVEALLARGAFPFYVSSSAPDAEVHAQLGRRGLSRRFAAIYGATTPKVRALQEIMVRHSGEIPVFFGDSVGDWDAANDARVGFVAVTGERDNFPGQAVVKLRDFASPEDVLTSIERALNVLAT